VRSSTGKNNTFARGMRAASEISSSVVLLALLVLGGRWLDGRWKSAPWMTLAGAVFGMAAAVWLIGRTILEFSRIPEISSVQLPTRPASAPPGETPDESGSSSIRGD
jgi:F0F1-type ATP synthase assembly protein I